MGKDKKDLKKAVSSATSWCEKARDILKIKQSGPRFNKDSVDSKRLEKAMNDVKSNLEKLGKAKSPKYEELMKSFGNTAGLGEMAVKEQNLEVARYLADVLEHLNNRVLNALGKLSDEELEQCKKVLLVKENERYEEGLKKARQTLQELEQLEDGQHRFVGKIPDMIEVAKVHFESDAISFALAKLGEIAAEEQVQRKKRADYAEYLRKLAEARGFEQQLLILDQMGAKNQPSKAKPVSDILIEAENLCQSSQYAEAILKLKEAKAKNKEARKGLSKSDVQKVETFAEAKSTFESLYKTEKDRILQGEKMRASDEQPAKGFLDNAKEILATARKQVDEARADELPVLDATKDLKKIEDYVKKAKEASEQAKKTAKEDVEAIKAWTTTLRAAENAYELIKSMPGTSVEQRRFFDLLGQARSKLTTKNDVTSGYAAAVKVLEGYPAILEQARQTCDALVSLDLPPDLQKLAVDVGLAIHEFSGFSPKFMSMIYFDELSRITGDIRLRLRDSKGTELTKAVSESKETLTNLASQIREEKQQLVQDKEAAELTIRTISSLLQQLHDANAPANLTMDAERVVQLVQSQEMIDREWTRARNKAENAKRDLEIVQQAVNQFGSDWEQRVHNLRTFKELARKMLDWPPQMVTAKILLNDCLELESIFARTFDFEECIATFDKLRLEERYNQLQADGTRAPANLKALREALNTASAEVREALSTLNRSLWSLENQLTGTSEPQQTDFHAKSRELSESWNLYAMSEEPDSPEHIASKKEEYLRQIAELSSKLQKLMGNSKLLASYSTQLHKQEKERNRGKLPEHVKSLIDRVELETGKDVTKYRKQYDVVAKTTLATLEREQAWQNFADELVRELDEYRKQQAQRFDMAANEREQLAKQMKKLRGKNLSFTEYTENVEAELVDVQVMLDSRDPTLLPIALKMVGELKEKVRNLDPKNHTEDTISFQTVEARWEELGLLLGTVSGTVTTDRVIEKRMPDTYQKLMADYQSAIAIARKSSPEVGMRALEPLEAPIRDALAKAQKLGDEFAEFEERVRQLENYWDEIKKTTKTRVTDRATAFAKYFEARLAEAQEMLKTENGLTPASKMLDDVKKSLDSIMLDTDPRGKLQQLDTLYDDEQRQIRDMARQFDAELSAFKNTMLVKAEETIKERAKKKEIRQADAADSLRSIKGLERQASAIANIVKPYLATIEVLKIGEQPAPILSKAQDSFSQARSMLAEAIRTADRLTSATITTNVSISEDFGKVQKNWTDQVTAYAKAIGTTIEKIQTAVKELEKSIGVDGGISQKDYDALDQNHQAAIKILNDAKGTFRVDAFANPFDVLADKRSNDKARLAARELALKTFREYRQNLLNHPVLIKLADKSNPFNQNQLAAAFGYLRAALKRIEIETLIGV